MTEERIDTRLLELGTAIREAVLVAVRLAQMSEWIEEAEMATNIEVSTTPEELSADALSTVSPDEAIRRLKVGGLPISCGVGEHSKLPPPSPPMQMTVSTQKDWCTFPEVSNAGMGD